jgi:hypothetical protein
VPLGWPPNNADWPQDGEPDYVEFDPNSSTNTVRGWLHVQNGGSSGQGQVELLSDVNANQWFVLTAERMPGKSYRWYVNGKLYKQVLAPGLAPKAEEAAVTKVLASPYTVPLDYLRGPLQFESKGTSQTNDVIVAIDPWSIWEPVRARRRSLSAMRYCICGHIENLGMRGR